MKTSGHPPRPGNGQAMSYEEFFRELFATPEKSLALGPRPGLEPPALPARFPRVRGGNQLVSYELLVAEDGRIAAKHERVAGSETYFIYEYDDAGHLLRAWRDGRLAEEYAYDGRGARVASWDGKDGQWKYGYDQRGRLTSAGPWQFSYAADGSLREAWTPQTAFFLSYDRAGGMSRVVLPRNRVLRCETMPPGLPTEKYVDARPVESLTWRSPLKLATYRDRDRGVQMQFHYTGQGRLPQAVTVQTPQGATNYLLGYDQVGSLKAVAAMDGESEGRVVKTIDYDSFGNVLSDSNPSLFIPIAFAGGLRDRFTGLVRFLHRDYDPTTGRFTAPDPLGDTGGDHDLYDYCVDEPVGRIDPEGLQDAGAISSGGFFSGMGDWFGNIGKKINGLFSPDEAQAAEPSTVLPAGGVQQPGPASTVPSGQPDTNALPGGKQGHAASGSDETTPQDGATGDKPAGWGFENSNGPKVGSPEWHEIRNRHANMVLYTPTAGEAVDRATSEGLQRMAVTAGHDVVVTAGKETREPHQKGSAHEQGQAADLSYTRNPQLTEERFRGLYHDAFDPKTSLALIEGNHFHIQTRPGKGGATGIRRRTSK